MAREHLDKACLFFDPIPALASQGWSRAGGMALVHGEYGPVGMNSSIRAALDTPQAIHIS